MTYRGLGRMTRKMLRGVQPVELGQSRGGFVVAAVLIAFWQLGGTAAADAVNPGFSENDFFRLEWEYDLSAGEGLWRITPDEDLSPINNLLTDASFYTQGVTFDTIELDGEPAPFGAIDVGDGTFKYSLMLSAFALDRLFEFRVTFPRQNVGLYSTEFQYEGLLSAAVPAPMPVIGSMNFVTIQQIPEPAGVALLGVGAAAAGAYAGRRRDDE